MYNLQTYLDQVRLLLLPQDAEAADDALLELLFERWCDTARAFLRLTPGEEIPAATMAQIIYNTAASYNASGDEGLTSSSMGGQSYQYQDLLEQLQRVMRTERKPRL